MYRTLYFNADCFDSVVALITEYPLATFMTQQSTGLEADLIPFIFEHANAAQPTLKAHISRANPLYRQIENGTAVMLLFQTENGNVYMKKYQSQQIE